VETPVEEQPTEDEQEQEQMVEVAGEMVPISQVVSGYMKNADYTQKTQALARDREQVEAMRQALDNFYAQDTPPEFRPQPPTQQYQRAQQQAEMPDFATPLEQQLWEQNQRTQQTLAELQQWKNNLTKQEVMRSVDNTLYGFKDAHPDLSEEQVVEISRTVRSRGLPYTKDSFDLVHKATSAPSPEELRRQFIAEYEAEQKRLKKQQNAAALEPGNVPAGEEAPLDIRSLPDEKIDALMAEDFRSMMG